MNNPAHKLGGGFIYMGNSSRWVASCRPSLLLSVIARSGLAVLATSTFRIGWRRRVTLPKESGKRRMLHLSAKAAVNA